MKAILKTFELRKSVAEAKVKSGYRPEHSKGVADAYAEAISDLKNLFIE